MRWAIWWFAILSAYVVEFATQTLGEVAAGAIIGFLCTVIIAAAYANASRDVRVLWRWLRHLARVPSGMIADALRVSRRVAFGWHTGDELVGLMVRVPFECGDGSDALANGREALTIFGLCAAPNTVVVDVDRARGELVVHQLQAAARPSESVRWPL